jgi:hypothetical protein
MSKTPKSSKPETPKPKGKAEPAPAPKPPEAPQPDDRGVTTEFSKGPDGRLKVTKTFPLGAIARPPGYTQPPAPRAIVFCPSCRSPNVKRYARGESDNYYRCGTCVDPTTADWTVFKVRRAGPAPAPVRG